MLVAAILGTPEGGSKMLLLHFRYLPLWVPKLPSVSVSFYLMLCLSKMGLSVVIVQKIMKKYHYCGTP